MFFFFQDPTERTRSGPVKRQRVSMIFVRTGASREVPDSPPRQARAAGRVPTVSGQRQGLGEALRPSRGVHQVTEYLDFG